MLHVDPTQAVGTKILTYKKSNLYALNGVYFPKVNDFLFRRALFTTSAVSRFKQLKQVHDAFKQQLDEGVDSWMDKNLLSAKRDKLLLYGSQEELKKQLELEAKYLPLEQTTSHHERYAFIVEISRQYEGTHPPESIIKELKENEEAIVVDSQLDDEWLECFVHNGDDNPIGRTFLAQDEDAASNYESLLQEAYKATKKSKEMWGFQAMGHIDMDSQLCEKKFFEKEAQAYKELLKLEHDLEGTDIKILEPVLEPGS